MEYALNKGKRRLGMVIGIILGILVIIGLGLYIIKPKTPKPPVDIVNVSDLEQYLKQVVAAEHPPGLSVAVVKDDTIVYANGFGVADAP